jgi:hypothetical protein
MMYVDVYYADPGNNAAGFGFAGADGSSVGQQNYPFSSPGDGIIEPGSISYPFSQACGTPQRRSSSVLVWVYDAAGARSNERVIHLVCPT